MVFGFVNITSGGFAWRRVWSILQAGPLWGYQSLPLSSSSATHQELISKIKNNIKLGIQNNLIDDNNNNSINSNNNNNNNNNSNDKMTDENIDHSNIIKINEKRAIAYLKRWSLAPIEGPERSRIRMQQEYGPILVIREKIEGPLLSKKIEETLKTEEIVKSDTENGTYVYNIMPYSEMLKIIMYYNSHYFLTIFCFELFCYFTFLLKTNLQNFLRIFYYLLIL